MNDSYEETNTERINGVFDDGMVLNETNYGTVDEEENDFDVTSYLAARLGPQRQPTEKVYHIN